MHFLPATAVLMESAFEGLAPMGRTKTTVSGWDTGPPEFRGRCPWALGLRAVQSRRTGRSAVPETVLPGVFWIG
jgi:hypothetical protein